MTLKRGINSKYTSRDFLKRGLRSMFPNYSADSVKTSPTPPVDTEKNQPQER